MTLQERINFYALCADSKATTPKGKLKEAVKYYAANRKKRASKGHIELRKFSDDERLLRRLKVDQKFRKNWVAKTRRTLKNSSLEDCFFDKFSLLISFCRRLKIKVEYAKSGQVERLKSFGERVAVSIFNNLEEFSGDSFKDISYSTSANAYTQTLSGDQYSRSCTYRKTDATHYFKLSPVGLKNLMDLDKDVMNESVSDGLPIISVEKIETRAAEVVWVKGSKKISSESGSIAWDYYDGRVVLYHSSSIPLARKGLAKKIEKLAEATAQKEMLKLGKPPLWKEKISLSEVRRLTGWCAPGCREWVQKYMGRNMVKADWADVARAAMKDKKGYGKTLMGLIGAVENGPYCFA